MVDLPRLVAERKSGAEPFMNGTTPLPLTLSDFWCWSTSDLLNSTIRGVLAEFLVATALGLSSAGVRDPWASYDLQSPYGTIEVKSAAYLQSWGQRRPSRIAFGVPRTRKWDPDTAELEPEAKRQADVYVFAVLSHTAKGTINPLDVCQWRFYVASGRALDRRANSARSITLRGVEALAPPVAFDGIAQAVRTVFEQLGQVV